MKFFRTTRRLVKRKKSREPRGDGYYIGMWVRARKQTLAAVERAVRARRAIPFGSGRAETPNTVTLSARTGENYYVQGKTKRSINHASNSPSPRLSSPPPPPPPTPPTPPRASSFSRTLSGVSHRNRIKLATNFSRGHGVTEPRGNIGVANDRDNLVTMCQHGCVYVITRIFDFRHAILSRFSRSLDCSRTDFKKLGSRLRTDIFEKKNSK